MFIAQKLCDPPGIFYVSLVVAFAVMLLSLNLGINLYSKT